MYCEAVITFIDILGFKEIIKKSKAEDVLNILKKVRSFSGFDDEWSENDCLPKVIQFSDSIIRIRPLNSEFRYGVLFHELNDLVLMQGGLAENKILVRGGVTIGNVHFDATNVFGDGFVRAYELESNFAIYPRIIVDPSLISMAKIDARLLSDNNSFEDEMRFINSQLHLGSDGIYSIDYLGAYPREFDDREYIPNFFSNIKMEILSRINGNCDFSSINAKYMWLANYYNQSVSQWFIHHKDTENLWITSEESSLLNRFTK